MGHQLVIHKSVGQRCGLFNPLQLRFGWCRHSLFANRSPHNLTPPTVHPQPKKSEDHTNPVDGDDVPVPHFGCVLSWEGFDRLAERLREHNVKVGGRVSRITVDALAL
jgi:hypothetical protein